MAILNIFIGVLILVGGLLSGYIILSSGHEKINHSTGVYPIPRGALSDQIWTEVKKLTAEAAAFVKTSPTSNDNNLDEFEALLDNKFAYFQRLMNNTIMEMSRPVGNRKTGTNVDIHQTGNKYKPPPLPIPVQETGTGKHTPNGAPVGQESANNSLDDSKPWKHIPLADRIGIYGEDQCQKQEQIYFLKTSKTGSTTIANILMRFGFKRPGTNFLLGESGNGALFFENGYMPFNEETCFIGRDIPNRPLFDISYIHMKYNRTAVDRIMKPNTFKISILRDPVYNFMSSWKYYDQLTEEMRVKITADMHPPINVHNRDHIAEMNTFLKKPWEYLKEFPYSHSAFLFAVNPQFVFFGKPSYLLSNEEHRLTGLVNNWIYEIESDFDHIIILEDLDRSLAVLMLKLCWEIDDVIHLKLNAMKNDGKRISQASNIKLQTLNWADYRLYDYFNRKLENEISVIGKERVLKVAQDIIKRSNELSSDCLQPPVETVRMVTNHIKHEKRRNQTCYLMSQCIYDFVAADQVIRWKDEFPEWRMDSSKLANQKYKGTKMPNFCSPNENFQLLLSQRDRLFRDFLHWPTNEYDYRNYIPTYLNKFAEPVTMTQRKEKIFPIFN